MKQWLKDIWHDPVWSKVISGIILFALGALFSLIKGWLSNTETISEAFISVFTYKINVWVAVAFVFVIMIASGIVKRIHDNNNKVPEPPFVNDFTEGCYQRQRWKWRWQWSKTNRFYYISDLSIVCPYCKNGLLTIIYMDYKCGKCGSDIPYNMLNVNAEAVEKQIMDDARKKYDFCAEYLGKLPLGIIKS